MSHKKLIQIHTYSDDEFMEELADRIAEKIGVVVSTQPRQYGDVSLKGPCWQTSATAMDHL